MSNYSNNELTLSGPKSDLDALLDEIAEGGRAESEQQALATDSEGLLQPGGLPLGWSSVSRLSPRTTLITFSIVYAESADPWVRALSRRYQGVFFHLVYSDDTGMTEIPECMWLMGERSSHGTPLYAPAGSPIAWGAVEEAIAAAGPDDAALTAAIEEYGGCPPSCLAVGDAKTEYDDEASVGDEVLIRSLLKQLPSDLKLVRQAAESGPSRPIERESGSFECRLLGDRPGAPVPNVVYSPDQILKAWGSRADDAIAGAVSRLGVSGTLGAAGIEVEVPN